MSLPCDETVLLRGYQSLQSRMSGDSSSGLSLGLANRIYLSGRDFDLAPDFKDKGREYFGAEPEEVDFALQETTEQINRWVEEQVGRRYGTELLQGRVNLLDPGMTLLLTKSLFVIIDSYEISALG